MCLHLRLPHSSLSQCPRRHRAPSLYFARRVDSGSPVSRRKSRVRFSPRSICACSMQAPFPMVRSIVRVHKASPAVLPSSFSMKMMSVTTGGYDECGRRVDPPKGPPPSLDLSCPLSTSCSLCVAREAVRPDRAHNLSDESVSVTLPS